MYSDDYTIAEEEAKETAKKVGLAALKYGDLSNQTSKDYQDAFSSRIQRNGDYLKY